MTAIDWLRERRAQPSALAGFDSATCMVRATASALRGECFPALGIAPEAAGRVLPCINHLPRSARQVLYAVGGGREGMDPGDLGSVRSEDLREWAVGRYPERGYPAVLIGSANGAVVHLAALLGVPWLPQTFLLPVRRDVDPGAPKQDLEWGRGPGRALLEANPDLQLHHMNDPNQDHLMVDRVAYFRVKSRRLGPAYEDFLDTVLAPGGTVVLVECGLEWPSTRVDDRHYFQFGAAGGVPPGEYHEGSDRIAAFLERRGSDRERWDAPDPDDERPEAEWGFEPALRDDAVRFAADRGHEVRRLTFEDTHGPSPAVADFYRREYASRGIPGDRLVVSSFALQDPWWTLRTGSVPYWSTFNTEPDADRLESYLEVVSEPYEEVHAMLFSNGVESAGQASIERWREVLARAERAGAFLGVDTDAYPADYGAYVRYNADFPTQIRDRTPLLPSVGLERFETFLDDAPREYDVELTAE